VTGRLDRSGAIIPLLPLRGGPLGPRLRKWPCHRDPDRALLRSLWFAHSRLRATSGHASANGLRRL